MTTFIGNGNEKAEDKTSWKEKIILKDKGQKNWEKEARVLIDC